MKNIIIGILFVVALVAAYIAAGTAIAIFTAFAMGTLDFLATSLEVTS